MQSFLIVAKDKNTSSLYVSNFLKEKNIHSLDINWETYEKAMGIEDVRNIQKRILLKPFKSKTKAIVIDALEDITLEAQNALLKTLEEPPANTLIIITTPRKDLILPTIISRCDIILLKQEEIVLNNEDLTEFNKMLETLLNGGIGDKLKIAQDVAFKKEVSFWLEKMAIFVKNKLTSDNHNSQYLNFLKELQKTYKNVKSTNVSQRAALENFFLSI